MVEIYGHFGGMSCFHVQSRRNLALIIKALCSTNMSVNLYETTQLHIAVITSNYSWCQMSKNEDIGDIPRGVSHCCVSCEAHVEFYQ